VAAAGVDGDDAARRADCAAIMSASSVSSSTPSHRAVQRNQFLLRRDDHNDSEKEKE